MTTSLPRFPSEIDIDIFSVFFFFTVLKEIESPSYASLFMGKLEIPVMNASLFMGKLEIPVMKKKKKKKQLYLG